MEYMRGVTGVHSTAAEAWGERKGVCQDIAHVALGALRSVGIPARYVSGYLHPDAGAAIGQTVIGESHAWVEWFAGEWRGYDPTNLAEVGELHVLVGRGRDYSDVSPLRGVYAGPERVGAVRHGRDHPRRLSGVAARQPTGCRDRRVGHDRRDCDDVHMPTFTDAHGVRIHYASWRVPDAVAVVQLVHGIGEHIGRYDALIEALNAAGYSVWADDHRGHGRPASSSTAATSTAWACRARAACAPRSRRSGSSARSSATPRAATCRS